jgi:hypothetical protein
MEGLRGGFTGSATVGGAGAPPAPLADPPLIDKVLTIGMIKLWATF